jgi:hypothetical protein
MNTTLVKMASGLIACLALAGIPSTAQADTILNVEPNDTFATAQVIPTPAFTQEFNPYIGTGGGGGFKNTSMTLPHVTILRPGAGQTTANLDYFRFHTFVPGIIVADIDNTPMATNFDTEIHLFTGSGLPLATNDNEVGTGPGDGTGLIGDSLDSRIETGMMAPGDYVVAVARSPSVASNGGGVTDPIPAGGSYTLNISAQAIAEPGALTLLGVGVAALMGYLTWCRRKMAVPLRG